jgi:hypothetical protein
MSRGEAPNHARHGPRRGRGDPFEGGEAGEDHNLPNHVAVRSMGLGQPDVGTGERRRGVTLKRAAVRPRCRLEACMGKALGFSHWRRGARMLPYAYCPSGAATGEGGSSPG